MKGKKEITSFHQSQPSSSNFPDQTRLSSALLHQVKDAASEATVSKQLSPSRQVFSGHMRLGDMPYSQILEDTESKDFKGLAGRLQEAVSFDTSPLFSFFFSVISSRSLRPALSRSSVPKCFSRVYSAPCWFGVYTDESAKEVCKQSVM